MTGGMDDKGILVSCRDCNTRNRVAFSNLDKRIRCGACKNELPPLDQVLEISTPAQFHALRQQAPVPLLVDFWAAWCGPCKMVAPELDKVAQQSAGHAVIAKVNTEELPEIAAQFQISSIPNLVLLRDGREVSRLGGARPAQQIVQFLRTA